MYPLKQPYFCGQNSFCTSPTSRKALELAKANIQKYYGVIGVLERLDDTQKVFEAAIPGYLTGFPQFAVKSRGKDTTQPNIYWVTPFYFYSIASKNNSQCLYNT